MRSNPQIRTADPGGYFSPAARHARGLRGFPLRWAYGLVAVLFFAAGFAWGLMTSGGR